MSEAADRGKINLAAKLSDGQKIYILNSGESVSQSAGVPAGQIAGVSEGQLINVNTASEAELDKLPSVGPVTAQKIVASRPYSTLEELVSKKAVAGRF